ncbi:hypothetical protein [Leptolyngbya ohadii]|uniref:hypothetical protein n=1 Tax=Leptolyngbya ohadii TaxID=1962290 RepID=UPI000B59A2A1|nr:hypothetical protein [Leptolyngbya ohadii]
MSIRDGLTDEALGIGIPEATSLVIDQNGIARVTGRGLVYLILGDHQPEYCEPGQSLTFTNFKIWKVNSGQTFNLRLRSATGFHLRTVDRGETRGNPYRAN